MRRSPQKLWLLAWLLAVPSAAVLFSCGEGDAQYTTRFIPDYPSSPHASVSVFGVFKDGRMSTEAWDYVVPLLSATDGAAPLPSTRLDTEADASVTSTGGSGGSGGGECSAAYQSTLVAKDMTLFNAVDGYTRANGVTEDLLEKFAPSAKGDLVMVITISGHVPTTSDAGDTPSMQPSQPPMGGSGRGGMVGRRGMQSTGSMRRAEADRGSLEMSASFYSRSLHRSVGLVGMSYTGKSADEALKKFVEKVRTVIPAPPCAGWGELKVDEAAIHDIRE
jgi:hypothetical protein